MATRRLVTVVGPGGVGKTRLVLEVAYRLVEGGHTAWWADLTTVTPERLVDTLAEATGSELPPTGDAAAALCGALRARRGVLCVDNAEHLLDALAPVLERLLASAPGIVVLATSRERLALDTESVRVLGPLAVPIDADRDNAAVRLFAERASGLALDSLSDADVGVIGEVCRRLDGLPLAIELGAARAATFGLRALAARLRERLDLLGGGRRTAADRHRTLRAVVDWSHGMLTTEETRLFHRLAVFPGEFSLDRVESVCGHEPISRAATAGLLARLVEQSLVQAGEGRFWLLETLRAYAGERLAASGEARLLRARHARDTADRLAVLDRQLWTPFEAAAVAGLTALVPDLHAAWDHASAHEPGVAVQLAGDVYDFAYVRQRLDLLDWGIQVASWDRAHPSRPRALAAAAAAAWARGRLDEAEEYAARGRAVAGGPSGARATAQLGNVAMFRARNDEALACFRAAGAGHRAAGEHVRAVADDISVAQVLNYAGRADEARKIMDEVLPLAKRADTPSLSAWAHHVSGETLADVDVGRALEAYSAAIEDGNQADCRLFVMLARGFSLALAARRAEPTAALEQFAQVLEQWERVGNELVELWVLRYLVVLLGRVEAFGAAAVLAGALLAVQDRYPSFGPERTPVETTVAHIRDRLGDRTTDDALAEGACLGYHETVDHARRAIRSAMSSAAAGPETQISQLDNDTCS